MKRTIVLMFLLGGLTMASAWAESPSLIPYQGRLVSGTGLVNGTVSLVLRVYTNESGGAYVYQDSNDVVVADGLYSTFLGDDTTFGSLAAVTADSNAYLEVVADGTTLSPRERIGSVLFSLQANGLKNNGLTSAMIPDGSIGVDDMETNVFWGTAGNAGTVSGTHYLGTSDNQPLQLHVRAQRAYRLEPATNTLGEVVPNVIGGHGNNRVTAGSYGMTIAGGWTNLAQGAYSTVSGGERNKAQGDSATVIGGRFSTADGSVAIAGGEGCYAGSYAVSLGLDNFNYSYASVISGGDDNQITNSEYSVIAGGHQNKMRTTTYSAIGGGLLNVVSNDYATVPGGENNVAGGAYSLAAGRRAKAVQSGSFVWADSTDADFASTSSNQFLIRARGGVGIGTANPSEELTVAGSVAADSFIATSNVAIGVSSAGEALHLEAGNILMNSSAEQEIRMRRTGLANNPAFRVGRIVAGGDGSPNFRVLYSDDFTAEGAVFEFDSKGTIASVKTNVGSHFEGFIKGDEQPLFRLNSFPTMRLEFGPGGSAPTDVALTRAATNTLAVLTGGAEQLRVTENGRVGIGTNAPSQRLEVRGNVKADRFYFSDAAWLQLDASGTNLLFVASAVTNRVVLVPP